MIITEFYKIRGDGVNLYHTYSDENKKIIRNDGIEFDEAFDVEDSGYTYTESENHIEEREVIGI